MRVEKNTFRVICTTQGKTLVESPLRLDSNGREPKQCLVLDAKGGVSVQEKSEVYPSSTHGIRATYQVVGVLGVVELSSGKFLVAATRREFAASVQSHKIWRVTGGELIPLGDVPDVKAFIQSKNSTDQDLLARIGLDRELMSQLRTILNSGHLYFSTTYDITHSLQHNNLKKAKSHKTVIDDRYLFNLNFLTPLLEAEEDLSAWIVKTVCGFVGTVDVEVNPNEVSPKPGSSEDPSKDGNLVEDKKPSRLYTVTLISRENQRRIGTRYVRRGLDSNGNAANNVEMEQIVFHHDYIKHKAISSFVQMRASAPGVWGQNLDLSYKPKLLIADINKPEVWSSIEKHFKDMAAQYLSEELTQPQGKIICVNLLDTAKFEGPLTETYEEVVKRVKNERFDYEEFPMHKYCKNMNYRNMDILLDRVRKRLVDAGWFLGEGTVPTLLTTPTSFRVARTQTGFARVSCLDSLDRTNLTCSWFAKYILPFQIQAVSPDLPAVQVLHSTTVPPVAVNDGAYATRQAIQKYMSRVTNLWADSGDAISILYAGTGALKADVTRNGKRLLIKGPLDDGLNAITRYYLNNFADGTKQDSYDLWTGKVTPKELREYASAQSHEILRKLREPVLDEEKSLVARLMPKAIKNTAEPILQSAIEYKEAKKKSQVVVSNFDSEGHPRTLVAFIITAIRLCGPENITSFFDLFVALSVFFYVIVLSSIFKVDGMKIVNRPKFSREYVTIHEIVGSNRLLTSKSARETKKDL